MWGRHFYKLRYTWSNVPSLTSTNIPSYPFDLTLPSLRLPPPSSHLPSPLPHHDDHHRSELLQFSIGFNSVYHLTDLPSFVSRRFVTFFDPHCAFLPRVSAANPGKRVDFLSSPILRSHPDQFLPYCAFGCDMEKEFAGTLFRFPLRTAQQAATSKLSRAAYGPQQMLALLREFEVRGEVQEQDAAGVAMVAALLRASESTGHEAVRSAPTV